MPSRTKRFYQLLFSAALLCLSGNAFGAACCGGGFSTPALIVGDDQAQVTASYSFSQIIDDVDEGELWRPRQARETSETYKIEAARVFLDRWQAGLSLPVVRRARAAADSAGLGDTSATLGYEYLPDWDYNPWRPKGIAFLELTAPTGRSIDESEALYQLDARGRGFWAAGAGTTLTKAVAWNFDLFTSLEGHRSFAKDYANSQSQGTLHPGYGGNATLGGGWSFADFRLGGSLAWTYEDPVSVSGSISSNGVPQRFATAQLTASYLFRREWSTTLAYADQTLFGSPLNTTLGRGVSLLLQRRWAR